MTLDLLYLILVSDIQVKGSYQVLIYLQMQSKSRNPWQIAEFEIRADYSAQQDSLSAMGIWKVQAIRLQTCSKILIKIKFTDLLNKNPHLLYIRCCCCLEECCCHGQVHRWRDLGGNTLRIVLSEVLHRRLFFFSTKGADGRVRIGYGPPFP